MNLTYNTVSQDCYCIACDFEGTVQVDKLIGCSLSFIRGKWFARQGFQVQEIQDTDIERIPVCLSCGKTTLQKRILGMPSTVVSAKDTSTTKAVDRLQRGLFHDSKKHLNTSKQVNKDMKQELFENVQKGGATEIVDAKSKKVIRSA